MLYLHKISVRFFKNLILMRSFYKSLSHKGLVGLLFAGALGVAIFAACSSSKEKEKEAPSDTSDAPFHADNDIAMTVCSLVDAFRVGEKIDSVDYDFKGVLTDGEGSPLYTDLNGGPGEWIVDVLTPGDVSIKNVELGDLLPGDLEAYLLESLQLGPQNKVYLTTEDADTSEDTDISVYDFEGGYIRFENRSVVAPNGLEGYLFTIRLSQSLPQGVETQTAV